jgi:uncharacterized protein DUF5018
MKIILVRINFISLVILFLMISFSCTDTTVSEEKLKSVLGDRWGIEETIEEIPKSSTKSITSFNFTNPAVIGVIDEGAKIITLSIPAVGWNTDLTSLTPTVTQTGETLSPASGLPRDFSSNITYIVTAEDGTKQDYTLLVVILQYNIEDIGPAGGWIFYINPDAKKDGWKYLEVAPQSTEWGDTEWGSWGTTISGIGYGIGSGKNNTNIIVNWLNSHSESGRAAQLCYNLSINVNGSIFDNWFLPSRDELNEVYTQLSFNGIGDFINNDQSYYWSSCQGSAYHSWGQKFLDGYQNYGVNKKNRVSGDRRVRAIRDF